MLLSHKSFKKDMKIDKESLNICVTTNCWAARLRHPKAHVTNLDGMT